MTSAIGWYGPLIDLSKAASHVGDFVQLLVFVHRTTPVQYKLSKGGEVLRTDIQVGDDTRPFFPVTLWQKQMGAMAVAGELILLQNVKIAKFGQFVEARTVQCSSLLRLVYPYESIVSRGVDDLIKDSRAGKTAMGKLRKVIAWVRRAGSFLYNVGPHLHSPEQKGQISKNWKVPEHSEAINFYLLSQVSRIDICCKAIFNASVGEIFLPITWRSLGDSENENMFVSRRLAKAEIRNIIEDFICTGCQLCGSPLDSENGFKQSSSLYCTKSSDHLHVISLIYRPFMLYVWDESEYLPLLVRNKAAELLFGNITADKISSSYRGENCCQKPDRKDLCIENISKAVERDVLGSCSTDADKTPEVEERCHSDKLINFSLIWMILLKMLLQQGKNTKLKFKVTVDTSLDCENGKYEMVSVSLPCIRT